MRKHKSKIFFIHLDVLESAILVSVDATGEQVVKFIEKFIKKKKETRPEEQFFSDVLKGTEGKVQGRSTFSETTWWKVLMLREKPSTVDMIGTLTHEADHMATAICCDLGIGISFDDDETHAYIIAYIVRQILRKT